MKRRFGPQHSGEKTIALTSQECGSAGGLPLCTPLATGLRYTVVDVSYGNMLLEFSAMFATTHGLQPSQATQPAVFAPLPRTLRKLPMSFRGDGACRCGLRPPAALVRGLASWLSGSVGG
jgi:hypothetical protein